MNSFIISPFLIGSYLILAFILTKGENNYITLLIRSDQLEINMQPRVGAQLNPCFL